MVCVLIVSSMGQGTALLYVVWVLPAWGP